MIKRVLWSAVILVLVFAGPARPDRVPKEHAEYTFARVQFHWGRMAGGFGNGYNAEGQEPWEHDFPRSEDFFLAMVGQVTGVATDVRAFKIVQLDSDELYKYPYAYFSEPGFMDLTDDEIKHMRQYFNRGGFAVFDDFRGRALANLEYQMQRVFPDRQLERILDVKDPIFHSFYEIDTLEMPPPYRNPDSRDPSFWVMRDEQGRIILMANSDNDFGEFWEDIDLGREALHPAVQSFQFGVNYLLYAMTH